MALTLTVIVPAYNEEKTIQSILESVARQSIEGVKIEAIVVDDASTDATPVILDHCSDLYTRLLTLSRNSGKGAAVIAGLQAATGDYVMVQDADMEYNPNEYRTLLKPVLEFGAEIVIGSRFLAPTWTRVNYF